MTKERLQKELKEKVKEGIKPSDLKKLKRSKSLDDIPAAPPWPLLSDQLKAKQQEIENLREKLETKNRELAQTQTELDNSLLARYEALKQFSQLYDKLQEVKQELNENVDDASEELIDQDETISKLREQKQKAQIKIQALEKDLNLSQRLAQMRKVPLFSEKGNKDYWQLALYSLVTVVFSWWLVNNSKKWNKN